MLLLTLKLWKKGINYCTPHPHIHSPINLRTFPAGKNISHMMAEILLEQLGDTLVTIQYTLHSVSVNTS